MAYNVPRYEELSVKHIFNKVKDDEDVMRYLDFYKDDKDLPERERESNFLNSGITRAIVSL